MGRQAPPLTPFSLSQPAARVLAFLVLPLAGALTAYALTSPPGTGPFGLLRVVEAPAVEVAGVRATGTEAGSDRAIDIATRLPPGTFAPVPEVHAQVTLTDAGGQFTTPDGVAFRLPRGAVTAPGVSVLTAQGARTVPTAPAGAAGAAGVPMNPGGEGPGDGVAGITDEAGDAQRIPGDQGQRGATPTVSLSYQPLELSAATMATAPAPHVVHLFSLSAVAADGRPVQAFALPLTLSVPFEPQSVNGWLALSIYDPDAGAWVELPVRAINSGRATVSAQTYRPGVIALLENRPPLAAPDEARTAPDTPVTVDVVANDADPDGDPLAVFERTTASAAGGEVRCAPTGACVYTPPPGFTGTDSFTYGLGDLRTHPSGGRTWSDNTAESAVTVHVE